MGDVDIPELAGVTPAEAWAMLGSDTKLFAWMAGVGMTSLPPAVSNGLRRLYGQFLEDARAQAAARQQASTKSEANLRRTDLADLRALVDGAGDRLPIRLRQVAHCTIVEGATIAQAAEALDMAPGTVRVHLRRLRAIARRNRR